MLGGALQRIDDAFVMIIRVRLEVRVPHNLLAELHLAIDHRRRLAIAAAEVKADAVAFKMPTQRASFGILRGQFGAAHHLQRVTVVFHADHVVVEFAELIRAIIILQPLGVGVRAAKMNLPTAALPQQKLHHALEVAEIVRLQLVIGREQHRAMMKHRAIGLLERDAHVHRRAGIACRRLKGAVDQNRRAKGRVEFGNKLRFRQKIRVTHFSGRASCSFRVCLASHCRPASGIISWPP